MVAVIPLVRLHARLVARISRRHLRCCAVLAVVALAVACTDRPGPLAPRRPTAVPSPSFVPGVTTSTVDGVVVEVSQQALDNTLSVVGMDSQGRFVLQADTPLDVGDDWNVILWSNDATSVLPALAFSDPSVGHSTFAAAVSQTGVVVGRSGGVYNGVEATYPVRWVNGALEVLTFPGSVGTTAWGISAHANAYLTGGGGAQGTTLWVNGTALSLQSVLAPYGSGGASPVATNDAGVAVGYGQTQGWPYTLHAVRWDNATPAPLPEGTWAESRAFAVNGTGIVVGAVWTGVDTSRVQRAAAWIGGTLTVLPTLPGLDAPHISYEASAVNDAGDIAGRFYGPSIGGGAVVWRAGGTVVDLSGTVPTGSVGTSLPVAITEGGVVGSAIQYLDGTYLVRWHLPPVSPGATTTGTSIAVTPVDPATGATPVTLTFATVTTAGTTTVTSSSTGTPPPIGFKLGNPPVYYDLQTTATFTGTVTVCFGYTPSAFQNAANLRLFHDAGTGGWVDVTTSNDPVAGTICGSVTSLSPFVFAELRYAYAGFFQPVDNPGTGAAPVVNTVKAGSAVPVKFALGGNAGLDVLAPSSPTSAAYACGSEVDAAIEQTVAASASGLTYDAVANQYVYTWKTDKAWAGTCRDLVVTLKDGTPHHALFKFTR